MASITKGEGYRIQREVAFAEKIKSEGRDSAELVGKYEADILLLIISLLDKR